MKKLGYILPPLFVFAFALTANAQKVDTSQNNGDTLKVTVTGGIDFHYVYRDNELTAMGAGGSSALGIPSSSTNTFEGPLALRLDIELSEKINAVLSLRTQQVDGGTALFANFKAASSSDTGFLAAGGGTDTNRWGANGEELGLFVDEASVTLNELFNPGLKLTAGIVPVSFDVRGKGSAFFFDPRHSSTLTKNISGTTVVGGTTVGGTGTVLGFSDELQPAGTHLVYSKDAISLGLYLLPAIIEGGAQTEDEAAYGVWFFYALESVGKGSRVGALVNWSTTGGAPVGGLSGGLTDHNNNIFTIGLGGDIQGLVEGLELYLEIYFQFGRTDDAHTARGWAMQLGGQYNLPNNENNIWFGLNFKYVSGDTDVTDERSSGFVSYENVNDTIVLEDQYFGLDLDTNYWTIQGSVGAAFTAGSGALKNNVEVSLLFGFFKLAQDVGTDGAGNGETDDIGHELDLRAKLWVSKQVSFDTAFGILFGSDIAEDAKGVDDGNRTTFLWTVGTNVRF